MVWATMKFCLYGKNLRICGGSLVFTQNARVFQKRHTAKLMTSLLFTENDVFLFETMYLNLMELYWPLTAASFCARIETVKTQEDKSWQHWDV